MRHGSTPASRTAAVVLGGLGLMHLHQLLEATPPASHLAVMDGCLGLLAVVGAAAMWRDNRFEARLLALLLSIGTVLGQALVLLVGPPGEAVHRGWNLTSVLLIALAGGLAVLLALSSTHRAGPPGQDRPYAL